MIPTESPEQTLLLFQKIDNFEFILLKRIYQKYKQALYFFSESTKKEDKEQVQISLNLIRKHKEITAQFNQLWNLEISNESPYHEIIN